MKKNQITGFIFEAKFLILIFCILNLNSFSQSVYSTQKGKCEPDSIETIYSDSSKLNEIGKAEYFFEHYSTQNANFRPFKIGFYKDGTDTAFYSDGKKIGYRVELNRGDEIHPQWISLGTFPRGFTFGASYHYYDKKHSYFEAYAGIFGMMYPSVIKMFSAGANYTRFFYKKEKPQQLYQSVWYYEKNKFLTPTMYIYQTQIDIVKNIHWGFQVGFSYDNVNGERATFYFNSGNQTFQLLNARSLSGIAGLTRFVSKAAQLRFGKDQKHVLRGANFRRLSFVIAYYPLLELKDMFIPAQEGISANPEANSFSDFYGKPFGWKIVWDGRLAFWSKRNWGIVYRYGVEQTPYRQYGRNGLVPIIAGGFFFNLGKNPSIKSNDWRM
jgi:hypothetical protein